MYIFKDYNRHIKVHGSMSYVCMYVNTYVLLFHVLEQWIDGNNTKEHDDPSLGMGEDRNNYTRHGGCVGGRH